MSIGTRIKEARIAKKLTQPQLADLLGVTKGAIGNYESDKSSPKEEILYRILEVLDVDANFIFQDEMKSNSRALTPSEDILIKKYRTLDGYGTDMVDTVLDKEYERCRATIEPPESKLRPVPISLLPASAGLGEWLDGGEWDEIQIPNTKEYKLADFAIRVEGDSMLPTYADGDIVLVHKQDAVNVGDVGIFVIDDKGYIKEQGDDRLISRNRKYDDIYPNEFSSVFVAGKVIGKIKEEEQQ